MPILDDFDFEAFWDKSEYALTEYHDDILTDDLLNRVERSLGYSLPKAYVALCRNRNGGAPLRTCHSTPNPTSWAHDHVAITNIKAIGFKNPWSLCGELGQENTLVEWGYPPIGVYFGDCPSAGHDMLCLDYRILDANGEPMVVHIDQEYDYKITPVAENFETFLRGLKLEEDFETA